MEPLYVRYHDKSDHHRNVLRRSVNVGCFFCLRIFGYLQITEWIDEDDTALCPYCGIDSVVPMDGMDRQLLHKMQEYWFGDING